MLLRLADRARTTSPVPLLLAAEARMLGFRLSSREHVRIREGVYVERAAFLDLMPWERYAVRVHAFVLRHPAAVLCLESAAVVLGLPLFGEPRDIHVHDPDRAASRRFGDVAVHTSRDPRTVVSVEGIVATSLLDTAVDLCRVLPPAQGLAVADSASSPAQGGTATVASMASRAAEQCSTRGRARLRWVWASADGAAESPAESVSRAVMEWTGFPRPVLQQEFHYEGCNDRVDFHFPGSGTIGEADGWQKYALGDAETAARRLAEEKRREDRLRRQGHGFARWDLADAWRVDPLVRALRAAGVRQVHAQHPLFLSTLARRPREKPRSS